MRQRTIWRGPARAIAATPFFPDGSPLPAPVRERLLAFWGIGELLAVAFLERSYFEVAEATLAEWQPEEEPVPAGLEGVDYRSSVGLPSRAARVPALLFLE